MRVHYIIQGDSLNTQQLINSLTWKLFMFMKIIFLYSFDSKNVEIQIQNGNNHKKW